MSFEIVDSDDATIYVGRYLDGWSQPLPWDARPFDCFVILGGDQPLGETKRRCLAHELAYAATKWVETFGEDSESIHDAVDRASVALGRQSHVGDGSPMTAWHDDMSIADFVNHIALGGHGCESTKVVLVVGERYDVNDIAKGIRHRISASR